MRIVTRALLPLVLPAVLIAWWWIASDASDSAFFPPLRNSLIAFTHLLEPETFGRYVVPTLVNFAAGFVIGSIVGIVLGTLFGLSRLVRETFQPVTEFARATPIAALVPIAMLVLGPTRQMEIALVALAAVWPTLLSTADGVRAVEPLLDDVSAVSRLNRRQRLLWITLRSAQPQIMAGLRIGLALALQVVIVAGMIAGTQGLGYFELSAQTRFDITDMWAGVFMLGLIGILASFLFLAFEHRLLAWHRGWRATEKETS